MLVSRSTWKSILLFLATCIFVGLLTACGRGGPAGGAATTTTPPATTTGAAAVPPAAAIQLLVSSPNQPSAGTTTVDVTAIATDSNSRAISGKSVTLSVTDVAPKAFLSSISNGGVSDTNGLVTAKLNVGTNKANRTVTLGASADSAIATNAVSITGTTVSISGNSSLVFNAVTPLTVAVRDSANTPIPGAAVTITSAKGNTLTPASGTTDITGQFALTVKGTVAGADTLTASALGASKTFPLTVSGANFFFVTPANGFEIPVSTPASVTLHFDQSGVNQTGVPITFAATRGAIVGSPAVTDGSGNATVTISSPSAGPATITASGPGGNPANSVTVTFVATSVFRVDVQANPPTVPVNLVGSSTNTSTITAVVRDAANNLVKNARVNFSITSDPSGGSLSSPSAITDVSGVATVTYIAGTITCCGPNATVPPTPVPSATNITITATVNDLSGTPVFGVSNTTTLTVGGQPLFVRLGTNNLVGTTALNYIKSFSTAVTDAAGNPVPNATVEFAVRPRQVTSSSAFAFFKGRRVFCQQDNGLPVTVVPPINPAACGPPMSVNFSGFVPIVSASCLNEDINANGILDPSEDTNRDGALTPGNVASVNTVATTDSSGFATANITYSKQFADWAVVTLIARAFVSGTEGSSSATFVLPVLAGDIINAAIAPPGAISPFGSGTNCTDAN